MAGIAGYQTQAKQIRTHAEGLRAGKIARVANPTSATINLPLNNPRRDQRANEPEPMIQLDIRLYELDLTKFNQLGMTFGRGEGIEELGSEVDQRAIEIIDSLQKNGLVKVISKPKVITLNGREAKLDIGQVVPVLHIDRGGKRSLDQKHVGFKIVATPEVIGDNRMWIDVSFENTYMQSIGTANVAAEPVLKTARVTTGAAVQNGKSLLVAIPVEAGITGEHGRDNKVASARTPQVEKRSQIFFLATPRIVSGAPPR